MTEKGHFAPFLYSCSGCSQVRHSPCLRRAGSYAIKRVIDGAINRNLAETSHILEDIGLKDQIWSKVEDFANEHGGELPSKEQLKSIVHDEIDSFFENEARTTGQKIQDSIKASGNVAKKYSNAVAAYFSSNQSQN